MNKVQERRYTMKPGGSEQEKQKTLGWYKAAVDEMNKWKRRKNATNPKKRKSFEEDDEEGRVDKENEVEAEAEKGAYELATQRVKEERMKKRREREMSDDFYKGEMVAV